MVLLAALVAATYLAVVFGGGNLLARSPNDLLLQVAAAALVSVAFAPARERISQLVSRVARGRRAAPSEVLAEVVDTVGAMVAEADALDRLAALLAAGTGAVTATVWLRAGDELHAAAVWPAAREAPAAVAVTADVDLPLLPAADAWTAVRDGDDLLGVLALETSRGRALSNAERLLLDDLAAAAGLVLRRVRLGQELADQVEQLRASRRRLVAAQDAARRSLERDLHDGAQQQLVAIKVRLGLARTLAIKEGDEDLAARLVELAAQADTAIAELRNVAHGIYPPLLAAEGLPAALAALGRQQPFPVAVDAGGLGRYPEPVEATTYFVAAHVLEAVARAGGRPACVLAREEAGELALEVAAEDVTLDVVSLTDRVDAVGGTVATRAGTVTVRLPLPRSSSAAQA